MSDNLSRVDTGASEDARTPFERVVDDYRKLHANDAELFSDENVVSQPDDVPEDQREFLSRLINKAVWTERRFEEAKQLKALYDARRARFERRLKDQRALIERAMTVIGIDRHKAREATATIGEAPASLVITDEGLIPEEWWKTERTLRRGDLQDHVRETGEVVDGTYLSNGGVKLTIRKLR